jgi:hypothetical protein
VAPGLGVTDATTTFAPVDAFDAVELLEARLADEDPLRLGTTTIPTATRRTTRTPTPSNIIFLEKSN